MQAIKDKYLPFITAKEEDYNEEFTGNTLIKLLNINTPPTQFTPSLTRTQSSIPSQILEAMKNMMETQKKLNKLMLSLKLLEPFNNSSTFSKRFGALLFRES
jgi:hypothetical protein